MDLWATRLFWDCPIIQPFWKDIKNIIENQLKVSLSWDPLTFLLDIFPDNLSGDQKFLLRLMLMTVRKTITICWLKPEPPSILQWTQKFKQVYLMEQLTAQLQLKTPVFERRWGGAIKNFLQ